MQRFWANIIKPIFEAVKPKNIIEIGSDNGGHTKNILNYCKQHNACLHVIDPLPKYSTQELEESYKGNVILHKDLSLNSINKIDKFDMVLIDGDHNWYTVFNELKLIEKKSKEIKQNFPIVLFHDIGWPYAKRDLYYDPNTVPEKYRHEHKKAGLIPGEKELNSDGIGINSHLHNAILEGGEKNGVLTAIEDFLKVAKEELTLIKVPGFNGLGILYSTQHIKNKKFREITDLFNLPTLVKAHIEQMEKDRNNLILKLSTQKNNKHTSNNGLLKKIKGLIR